MVDKPPPWPAFYLTVFHVNFDYLFTPWMVLVSSSSSSGREPAGLSDSAFYRLDTSPVT